MKKILLISLAILGNFHLLFSETYYLDLSKSIEVAKLQSYDMLSLKQDLKIAEFNLKSATSKLKTHIDLNLSIPDYSETMRRDEDSSGVSFYPVKQMNYDGNLVINQPLPTDGKIYIQSGLSDFDDYNKSLRTMNLNARVGLIQPINSLYGYNSIKSALRQAKLAYENSSKRLKREDLNLVYNVTSSFYSLLSVQKGEEIAKLNMEKQKEAYEIAKNKYKSGLIREVDALQMEVDLAAALNNYDLAIINKSSVMNSFKELIGIELQDSVVLNGALEYKIIVVDPEKAVSLAISSRLEIREQEIQIELNKINIKRQRSEGMVKGDLTAYFEKNGVSKQAFGTSYKAALNDSYMDLQNRPRNFGVGFKVSIPVLDWGENRALVNAAKAQLQQNIYRKEEVRRSIEREVRNLVAQFNSSLRRLQLLEKNVKVAEKSFDITRQRFSDGDIDSQSLALERDRLNTAYKSHLGAYIDYQLMQADLMRKTFYDFERNLPVE
ncbi:MAG: TolC family protein [Bacteroidales bacterium]|nr:TolC family protein [Bacteroidales bacterium]